MSTRNTYHVLLDHSSGKWRIVLAKSRNAPAALVVKEEAIQKARELAETNMPSLVIVHNTDGTVQTKYIYEDDPFSYDG
ncbi:MAG: DUF2188 domain-containing protein [Deltaproteobacteria bacterium]